MVARRYTKLGYSGNLEPSFSMKTAVMCKSDTTNKLGDMDFYLGDDVRCLRSRVLRRSYRLTRGPHCHAALAERLRS